VRVRSTVSTAAVVYDIILLMDINGYIKGEAEQRWYHGKIDALRRVDCLFAISQSTMNDAIRFLDVNPTRIRNISSAADSCFSSSVTPSINSSAVVKRFGISRRYLMHSSAFDARKNFQGLIRAYATLPAAIRSE
jgi:hypothetical protein